MHITYGDFWFLVWGQIKNKLFDSHYHPEIGNPLKGKDETPNFWKLPSWQNDLQGQKKDTDARIIHYYTHFRVHERLSSSVGVASLVYWLGQRSHYLVKLRKSPF